MKILMVSNLYPPYYVGGYELRCALVAAGLRQAGHDVMVLTSRFGLNSTQPVEHEVNGVRVRRILGQYYLGPQDRVGWPYFLAMVRPQLCDAHNFNRVLEEFEPDLINWWSVMGLTKAILSIPRLKGIPDVFCVEDDWVIEEKTRGELGQRPLWAGLWGKDEKPWYWRPVFVWLMERWKTKLFKQGIETATTPFSPTHVCFASEFLCEEFRAAGFDFPSTEVLYGGVEADKFFFQRNRYAENREPLRLLYAGQITPDRGLHTALEAVGSLPPEAHSLVTFTVVGDSFDGKYLQEVHEQVRARHLSEKVLFAGKKGYDQMPPIYRCHDVLIAPSLRKEGLPLSMVEAMLSGCAVVTTGSGGAIEIARLADLPLFPKGDALALSRILDDLIGNRQALAGIARHGQEVALREFSADRMIKRLVNTFQGLYEEKHRRETQDSRILRDHHTAQSVVPERT